MKILRTEVLISKGSFPKSDELETLLHDVYHAIKKVSWPPDSDIFTLNPVKKGNGVKPIKTNCMIHLEEQGWILEHPMALGARIKPGPVDAVLKLNNGKYFAVEWETGNISSSHRAVNKLAIGLLENVLEGGLLILPSRDMYQYLTDRIGNYAELAPYFPVWEKLTLDTGYLAVVEIEHEELSENVAFIPKGTDGMALFQKDK
ncbi:Restriction endonuclease BamHI (plasmid) [Desulfocapsa sulfexigens DSM 10523]|uniref:Restriction endonuclease BamHI n=1 Tax=Desulfocapsa sulfexigens (strain DSM 10523 / SB164P1) TaxID=1167006 RepID=M1PEY9_DESSD|nr:Restriction endonuclease BamHI [Desulfocapsa sulfexigens]AGF80112.1 Restriction endonuclease BamHI [Desulfocapsa sulfexigens DSM 10523]